MAQCVPRKPATHWGALAAWSLLLAATLRLSVVFVATPSPPARHFGAPRASRYDYGVATDPGLDSGFDGESYGMVGEFDDEPPYDPSEYWGDDDAGESRYGSITKGRSSASNGELLSGRARGGVSRERDHETDFGAYGSYLKREGRGPARVRSSPILPEISLSSATTAEEIVQELSQIFRDTPTGVVDLAVVGEVSKKLLDTLAKLGETQRFVAYQVPIRRTEIMRLRLVGGLAVREKGYQVQRFSINAQTDVQRYAKFIEDAMYDMVTHKNRNGTCVVLSIDRRVMSRIVAVRTLGALYRRCWKDLLIAPRYLDDGQMEILISPHVQSDMEDLRRRTVRAREQEKELRGKALAEAQQDEEDDDEASQARRRHEGGDPWGLNSVDHEETVSIDATADSMDLIGPRVFPRVGWFKHDKVMTEGVCALELVRRLSAHTTPLVELASAGAGQQRTYFEILARLPKWLDAVAQPGNRLYYGASRLNVIKNFPVYAGEGYLYTVFAHEFKDPKTLAEALATQLRKQNLLRLKIRSSTHQCEKALIALEELQMVVLRRQIVFKTQMTNSPSPSGLMRPTFDLLVTAA